MWNSLCFWRKQNEESKVHEPESFEELKNVKPRTTFMGLTPHVRSKIWRLLTQKDRLNIRRVNKYFKREVEVLGGLHTEISSQHTNIDYLGAVETTRCRFLELTDDYFKDDETKSPLRCPYNVEKLDVMCTMSWLIVRVIFLPMSATLRYLEFRQMSLMERYINPNGNSNEPIQLQEFGSLNTLVFHYGSIRDGDKDNFRLFNANMTYLLKLINAPNLEVFTIAPVFSVVCSFVFDKIEIPHEYCRWESKTLKLFVERHRLTLRKLNITLYREKLSPEDQKFLPPTNLEEYSCYLPRLNPGLFDTEHAGDDLFPNYWTKILRKAKQLRHFGAQVENWGRASRFRIQLRSALKNNFTTITSVLINSYHTRHPGYSQHHLTLDMGVFGICQSLRVLHIRLASFHKTSTSTRRKSVVETETYSALGIEKLPKRIESLQFKNLLCYSGELAFITTLPYLTSCQLLNCGRRGLHGVTFEIARALLTHRKITYLRISDLNEEHDYARLVALIKKFNDGLYEKNFEVFNPSKKIPLYEYILCCCCLTMPGNNPLED